MEKKLDLIKSEIKKVLRVFGADKFPNVEMLNSEQFSEELFKEAKAFLGAAQSVYNNRRKEAKTKLDANIENLTSTEQKKNAFYVEHLDIM